MDNATALEVDRQRLVTNRSVIPLSLRIELRLRVKSKTGRATPSYSQVRPYAECAKEPHPRESKLPNYRNPNCRVQAFAQACAICSPVLNSNEAKSMYKVKNSNGSLTPNSIHQTHCHAERSEALAERSRSTPCTMAVPAA